MTIETKKELAKACNKRIQQRIGENDSTLTYQEVVFYHILRACADFPVIDVEEKFQIAKRNGWIDSVWLTMEASKFNKMTIDLPWDKVF